MSLNRAEAARERLRLLDAAKRAREGARETTANPVAEHTTGTVACTLCGWEEQGGTFSIWEQDKRVRFDAEHSRLEGAALAHAAEHAQAVIVERAECKRARSAAGTPEPRQIRQTSERCHWNVWLVLAPERSVDEALVDVMWEHWPVCVTHNALVHDAERHRIPKKGRALLWYE